MSRWPRPLRRSECVRLALTGERRTFNAHDAIAAVAVELAEPEGWTLEHRAATGCKTARLHLAMAAEAKVIAARTLASKPTARRLTAAELRGVIVRLLEHLATKPDDRDAARLLHLAAHDLAELADQDADELEHLEERVVRDLEAVDRETAAAAAKQGS